MVIIPWQLAIIVKWFLWQLKFDCWRKNRPEDPWELLRGRQQDARWHHEWERGRRPERLQGRARGRKSLQLLSTLTKVSEIYLEEPQGPSCIERKFSKFMLTKPSKCSSCIAESKPINISSYYYSILLPLLLQLYCIMCLSTEWTNHFCVWFIN